MTNIPPQPADLPSTAGQVVPQQHRPAGPAGAAPTAAILCMCLTSFIFSIQDTLTRHLGAAYSPFLVVMFRYWFMAVFVTVIVSRTPGGLRRAIRSKRPGTQIVRGLLLVGEIVLMVYAFVKLGLVGTHAIFACAPLLVSALSGPVLGEKVGWRRWTAVGVGFIGILIILNPGATVFSVWAIVPLAAATTFAVYGLLTRHVAKDDSALVSFFWTGITGAIAITLIGIWQWEPLLPIDWFWMAMLCVTGVTGHWLLIRSYEMAEASALQPFSYLQLVFVAVIGFGFLGEEFRLNVIIGAVIVVSAGLFTLIRARQVARQG